MKSGLFYSSWHKWTEYQPVWTPAATGDIHMSSTSVQSAALLYTHM